VRVGAWLWVCLQEEAIVIRHRKRAPGKEDDDDKLFDDVPKRSSKRNECVAAYHALLLVCRIP
jgi:hypothetical protein